VLRTSAADHVSPPCSRDNPARRWLDETRRLDVSVYAAIAATPTPTLDVFFRRLSRAADHSKLWLGSAAAMSRLGGGRGRRAAAMAWPRRTHLHRREPDAQATCRASAAKPRRVRRAGHSGGRDAPLGVLAVGACGVGICLRHCRRGSVALGRGARGACRLRARQRIGPTRGCDRPAARARRPAGATPAAA
jgi:hypothetical protein